MRDAYDMMEYLEDILHDTQANMWSDLKKLRALNAAYDQICNRVIELYEDFWYTTATLTPGTAAWSATPFDFPAAPDTISKILYITDTDGVPVEPITPQTRDYSYPAVADRNIKMGYWLGDGQIWVNADSFVSNLRLYYIRKPARMLYGTADAKDTANTTITLQATMKPSLVDDYYNSLTLAFREGTDAGTEVTISDYVGSSGVTTISAAVGDTDTVYGSVSELPDGHNEVVVIAAAIRALAMDVAQADKITQLTNIRNKLEFDLIDFLQNRQVQKSRGVHMTNLD